MTYIGRREVALLGGEVRGGGDGEVTTLVLVEDASEDGGRVEIGNTVGLDWIKRVGERWLQRGGISAPEPSKLTWERRIRDQDRKRRCCRSRVRLFSDFRCCEAVMSVGGNGGEKEEKTDRPWSDIAV